MKIFPDAKVQTLAECKPGQLVRCLEYGQGEQFGLVFEVMRGEENSVGILTLEDENPVFELSRQPDQVTVLAYSGEVVFEIDQSGPLETSARDLYSVIGVVIADKDGWIMNVSSPNGYGFRNPMQFNLQTGRLEKYRERLSNVGIFGAWAAYLEDLERPTQNRVEVAKFQVKKSA